MKPHRTLAAAVVVAALAAPAAQAAPIIEPGSGATPEPSAPAMTTTIDEGFDWGSAAIGAGGAGAVIALVALGGFAYSSRGRMTAPR
jgi:hypothetical protein